MLEKHLSKQSSSHSSLGFLDSCSLLRINSITKVTDSEDGAAEQPRPLPSKACRQLPHTHAHSPEACLIHLSLRTEGWRFGYFSTDVGTCGSHLARVGLPATSRRNQFRSLRLTLGRLCRPFSIVIRFWSVIYTVLFLSAATTKVPTRQGREGL